MPIGGRRLPGVAALLFVFSGGFAAHAQQQPAPEVVMAHMLRDVAVNEADGEYVALVKGAALYTICPQNYPTDAQKQAFIGRAYDRAANYYIQAFTAAHQRLTYKLPGQGVIDRIGAHIADRQKQAQQEITALVRERGCDHYSARSLVQWLEYYRVNEARYAEELARKHAPGRR